MTNHDWPDGEWHSKHMIVLLHCLTITLNILQLYRRPKNIQKSSTCGCLISSPPFLCQIPSLRNAGGHRHGSAGNLWRVFCLPVSSFAQQKWQKWSSSRPDSLGSFCFNIHPGTRSSESLVAHGGDGEDTTLRGWNIEVSSPVTLRWSPLFYYIFIYSINHDNIYIYMYNITRIPSAMCNVNMTALTATQEPPRLVADGSILGRGVNGASPRSRSRGDLKFSSPKRQIWSNMVYTHIYLYIYLCIFHTIKQNLIWFT